MEAKQATTTAYGGGGGGDPFGNTLGSPPSENGQGMGGSVTDRRTDGRPFGREEEEEEGDGAKVTGGPLGRRSRGKKEGGRRLAQPDLLSI